MKRFVVGAALASLGAIFIGACSDPSTGPSYGGGGGGSNDLCSPYSTCETCTPVQGCGWCFTRSGGACASSPDLCAQSVSEFTWTWNASGCPGVDASVAPLDAGNQ
jgi:hypothetical protein